MTICFPRLVAFIPNARMPNFTLIIYSILKYSWYNEIMHHFFQSHKSFSTTPTSNSQGENEDNNQKWVSVFFIKKSNPKFLHLFRIQLYIYNLAWSLQNLCDILWQRWRRTRNQSPHWNVNVRSCPREWHRAWRLTKLNISNHISFTITIWLKSISI